MARIAAVQMNSGGRLEDNLTLTERLLDEAAQTGARMAVLPENFCLMPAAETDRLLAAEREGEGLIQDFLARCARERQIWLVTGTLPIRSAHIDRVYATTLVYSDTGVQVGRYDKIHLFDVELEGGESYRESEAIAHGDLQDNLVCVDTPVGRIGLAVCYDLRFPELFRELSRRGAELFVLPSAFTVTTGRAHWETLLKARAIENLAYMVAPGQWGEHVSGRITYGHSMIIDPWGDKAAELEEGDGVITADINLDHLARIRRGFPALRHRRLQ